MNDVMRIDSSEVKRLRQSSAEVHYFGPEIEVPDPLLKMQDAAFIFEKFGSSPVSVGENLVSTVSQAA